MSEFGRQLIQSLEEAIAWQEGRGPARVTTFPTAREVRRKARFTQAQMAPLLGMSLSGYRKIEQGQRPLRGAAAVLLRIIDREPEAVRRALSMDR